MFELTKKRLIGISGLEPCIKRLQMSVTDSAGSMPLHISLYNNQLGGLTLLKRQQQYSGTPVKTTATTGASLELQSAPAYSREVFGTIPLSPAFALPAVIALYSAPYSRVYTSIIGDIPPASKTVEILWGKRRVRKNKGKVHKRPTVRNSSRCLVFVRNHGPNLYTCAGRTLLGKCQHVDTTSSLKD